MGQHPCLHFCDSPVSMFRWNARPAARITRWVGSVLSQYAVIASWVDSRPVLIALRWPIDSNR